MRRERGFALPSLVDLLVVLAIVTAVGGIVWAAKAWLDGIDQKGYERGVQETQAAYAKRDNQALKDAIAAKEAADKRVLELEAGKAAAVAEAAQSYERRLANERALHEKFAAGVRSGAIRLRDPGNSSRAGGAEGAGDAAGKAPGSAGKCDGAQGGELSGVATAFLWDEATRADEIALQLGACQAVIQADRK